MTGIGAGSLPAGCSECSPPEAVLRSRAEADLQVDWRVAPASGNPPEMLEWPDVLETYPYPGVAS